ncbi:unnamed protein product [Strongylus vulgaris]|uniref:Metalloendopeptidase n=1 Tax=Strongylus vulgaris TaxID=40348 RepID=A0A3P7KAP2_STRVU|nr:unnamed protein product [Strongylus vulgaris]
MHSGRRIEELFKKGALEWQKDTCINFYESPNGEGTSKYTLKLVEKHVFNLCMQVGIAAHEIGHAIGMFHTQSRHDRDQYIMLDINSIKPDGLDQFDKEPPNRNENYGIPYDYGSIMHYGSRSFSYNKQRTMIPYDDRYVDTLGSPFISFYELLMMNIHYNCLDKCKSNPSAAKCYMGGFPHPRDCSKCICPGGYGGKLCNERPQGCGKILQATSTFQPLEDSVGYDHIQNTRDAKDEFLKCNYWIQAPQGRRIEVKFVSTDGVATDGCYYDGVEIKAQKDQRLTGYRYLR